MCEYDWYLTRDRVTINVTAHMFSIPNIGKQLWTEYELFSLSTKRNDVIRPWLNIQLDNIVNKQTIANDHLQTLQNMLTF